MGDHMSKLEASWRVVLPTARPTYSNLVLSGMSCMLPVPMQYQGHMVVFWSEVRSSAQLL